MSRYNTISWTHNAARHQVAAQGAVHYGLWGVRLMRMARDQEGDPTPMTLRDMEAAKDQLRRAADILEHALEQASRDRQAAEDGS